MCIRSILSLLLSCMILCSCGTPTGDPTKGGLFGWDENLAKQRAQDLARQEALKKQQVHDEMQRNQALQQTHDSERDKLDRAMTEYAQLAKENRDLLATLVRLSEQRHLNDAAHCRKLIEVNKRNAKLEELKNSLILAKHVSKNQMNALVREIADDNENLRRAISLYR